MRDEELKASVRRVRAAGGTPRDIARALGVGSAVVAPIVREIAAEAAAAAPNAELIECLVSPGWSAGLRFKGRPEWRDSAAATAGANGLASVLVARRHHRRRKVAVCAYLVDTWCLGAKDAFGPRVIGEGELPRFADRYFDAFDAKPLTAPLDLAQHLVLGAVEFARELGFRPHRDFDAARSHLGTWSGPSEIGFGKQGKPYFIEGPRDDGAAIIRTLLRSVGDGNFHFIASAGESAGLADVA